MDFAIPGLIAILLLLISSLGPGLLIVRHFRWRPMETLVGAVAASLLFQYLAAFAIYATHAGSSLSYVVSGVSVVALVVCRQDLLRLWNHRATRLAMLAQMALFGWVLLLSMLLRNYSGGPWCCDWLEHYQRARFFTDHLPLDQKFLGIDTLSARPPMMNLIAAHFMNQMGTGYDIYQVTFLWLNALAFLPCCLLARHLPPRSRVSLWLLAGVFALNPMFVENTLYAWTKLFAAFYVIAALAFYLSAWRRSDSLRMTAAFCCMACAVLVHYSAAPVLLFMTGHYLYVTLSHPKGKSREFLLAFASSVAILLTWFGWSIANLGAHTTFSSNSTSEGFKLRTTAENIGVVGSNIWSSLVPYPLHSSYSADPFVAKRPFLAQGLPLFRDEVFVLYQMCLPTMFGLGFVGLVGWLVWKYLVKAESDLKAIRRYRIFWISCLAVVIPLGIAVHPDFISFGVAHICLQPIVLIGLTMAAMMLPSVPPWARLASVAGLGVDAALGVLLHIHLMKVERFDVINMVQNGVRVGYTIQPTYNDLAYGDWLRKTQLNYPFVADHFAGAAGLIEGIVILIGVGILTGMAIALNRKILVR